MAASSSYEKERETVISLIEDYLATGAWTSAVVTDGVEFKTTPNKSGHAINVFYGRKTVGASVERILDFSWNNTSLDNIKQFDPDCLDWSFKDTGPQERVVYQRNKIGWPIWDRSFVSLWFVVKRGESTLICYTGITHPDYPESPKSGMLNFFVLFSLFFFPNLFQRCESHSSFSFFLSFFLSFSLCV